MARNVQGEWVKYECELGKWDSEESSYTRLCDDLSQHKSTGWDLEYFADCIYGEKIPSDGPIPSDIYIYYVINKNKRKARLCLISHKCEDEEFFVSI